MIEAGTNTDASREIVRTDGSKQALISRIRGKRKRRRNRYSLINSSNCRYDLVRYTATKFSIKESLENWNIYWTDLSISVQRCKEMKRFQRINHFPGMMEICRKDLLARNLNRLYKAFPEEYNVFPKTWCLPTDMAEVTEYAKTHKGKCFIVKPDQGCQGRGIAITKNINQLKTYDRMICQQYIQRPFLIDGYKFDLRIYVLITSCDPMRLFVYNEGLARFATAKYKEPNVLNASNMYMHLTNYSVNKHSRTYIVDDIEGSKRKLSTINLWFQKNNYDVKKIWESIDDVIIKTMIVSLPTLKHYYHTCFPNHSTSHACFEILGFDFMFDYRLKPYVLEVNHSPSFNTETSIDHEVKESLLYDTFSILNLQHNNRFRVLIEDKKRARDRLFSVTHSPEILSREKAHEDRISQHRVEWESTHLGNYRKIYPGKNDEYYEKFIGARQNTMYAETVSSKAKEAVPKVGEQAGPSRGKIKKLKVSAQDASSLKTKEGGGDEPMKEEPKPVAAADAPPVVFECDETSRTVDIPISEKPQSPAKSTDMKLSKSKTDVPEEGKENKSTSESHKQTLLPAEPDNIDELDERERILNMKKREFLVKSHGILEKVYENLKNAGLLKLETEIKVGRSNKWETVGEGSKAYIDGYQKFNKSMVQVLDCISKNVELRLSEKTKSGDILPDTGLGFDRSHTTVHPLKSNLVPDVRQHEVSNAGSRQDDNARKPPVPVGVQDCISRKAEMRLPEKTKSGDVMPDSELGFDKAYSTADHLKTSLVSNGRRSEVSNAGTLLDDISRKLPAPVSDCISRKTEMRVPVKVKSGEVMLDFGMGLDRPCSRSGLLKSHSMSNGRRFEIANTGTPQTGLSRRPPVTAEVLDCISRKTEMRVPEKVKSGDLLPDSLLKIDRPYTTAGLHKMSGRRFEVSDNFSRKPPVTVEVVTPYVRQTTADRLFERDQKPATAQGTRGSGGGGAPVLKIGHFGKPEAWGSLEEYFEQRKILNRSWQNTDV